LGRFISSDTIVPEPGNSQSFNRYAYVYNNPLKYTDPSGHLTDDQIREYTDWQTDEEFEELMSQHEEIYWMLRALHFGDKVWVDQGDLPVYTAILSNGDLFFADADGNTRDARSLIGSRYFEIDRRTPSNSDQPVYLWIRGDDSLGDPETCYSNSWKGGLVYHREEVWQQIMSYNVPKAMLAGMTTGGLGLMIGVIIPDPGITEVVGAGAGFVIGVTVDLASDAYEIATEGGPEGRMAGDEIYRYTYDNGDVEMFVFRGGNLIFHEWNQELPMPGVHHPF
jgi:hypothetical protein